MPFSVGDKVQVTAALGGFTGFVTELIGGPVDFQYRITNLDHTNPEEGHVVAQESQIAAGPLTKKSWSIGELVSINARGGRISAINGNEHTVDIDEHPDDPTIRNRVNIVEDWQLELEN